AEIVARSNSGIEKWMAGLDRVTVYRAHARFTGPSRLQVGDAQIEAERIFLDVGGRPQVPPLPGLETVPYLTNVSMMDLDTLPRHLVVIGGSYVGLEFAQMMRRFGSEVTVVEKGPRLVGREDPDVSEAITAFLRDEGIRTRCGATCLDVRREPQGLSVGLDCEDGEPREQGTHLLLALGRTPNTDD